MPGDFYSDAEVDDMCAGLTRNASKIKFLRGLGLRVDRKPNGRPLAWRPATTPAVATDPAGSTDDIRVALERWAADRELKRKTKKS